RQQREPVEEREHRRVHRTRGWTHAADQVPHRTGRVPAKLRVYRLCRTDRLERRRHRRHQHRLRGCVVPEPLATPRFPQTTRQRQRGGDDRARASGGRRGKLHTAQRPWSTAPAAAGRGVLSLHDITGPEPVQITNGEDVTDLYNSEGVRFTASSEGREGCSDGPQVFANNGGGSLSTNAVSICSSEVAGFSDVVDGRVRVGLDQPA